MAAPPSQLIQTTTLPRWAVSRQCDPLDDTANGQLAGVLGRGLRTRWDKRVDFRDRDAIAEVSEYGGALRLADRPPASRPPRKLYADDGLSTVSIMASKRYGAGQYRYFHAPIPSDRASQAGAVS